MNLFQLLNQTVVGNQLSGKLQDNIASGCKYTWVEKINGLLENTDELQINIIKKNFSSIIKKDQIFDKLCEILVATRFIENTPLFFPDNQGMPDLFLSNGDKYIEVKHLNHSNYEKWCLDNLEKNTFLSGEQKIFPDSSDGPGAPIRKAQYLINDALCKFQRNNKLGSIVLVFSLDKLGKMNDWKESEKIFCSTLIEWFIELNPTNISLDLVKESELFK